MVSGMSTPDKLPDDIAELKAIIRAQQDQNTRLEALVASFKKALFGAKSEKMRVSDLLCICDLVHAS
jgi:hypothetical protein